MTNTENLRPQLCSRQYAHDPHVWISRDSGRVYCSGIKAPRNPSPTSPEANCQ